MSNSSVIEGKEITNKKLTLIFLNINISCIATSMLFTALTTALPPIMKDFNIDVDTGQWLTSGFSLFLAVMTPFTAYLIKRFRTKRLYCIAIVFFIIGLIICAISKNFYMMMFGRIIQGCGNGLLSSMAQVIILVIFPPERIGSIMGWYGLSINVAPIISPTIAGFLVDSVGWRMIFIISIAIMSISLICTIFVFENVLPTIKEKFDFISLILSALTFGGITFSVGNIGTNSFISYQVLLSLLIGIVSGIIFTWRQLHLDIPFLDIRIIKNKNFTISLIATVLLQISFMGTAIIFPIYVQQIKGYSATISGLVVLPGSLAMAIISPFAGKIYDKVGIKLIFILAPLILSIGNFIIYFINIHQSIWIISIINIFRCISFAFLFMPLVTWAMKDIPKIKTSDASAIFNSIRFIGSAVGPALCTSIITRIANATAYTKESPRMYGINIDFLLLTILSLFVFLLGVFGCKEKIIIKNDINQENIDKKPKQEIITKDITDIKIIIEENEGSYCNISINTIVDDGDSNNDISIKDKSDEETIIEK
ncbi:MFS general substrate transporter [Piromyces finnis]|uniref:MFS general substrate transporter n=1 Tax=Piromyces finnis TaxID=1754191 RepID=A0A1Y1UTN5_9FUNG|nr:MFS general substrate transporter [Piromyces finnis]|eukprot:ORX41322.1 MFS general substrate transporter [Piromyces finnis]